METRVAREAPNTGEVGQSGNAAVASASAGANEGSWRARGHGGEATTASALASERARRRRWSGHRATRPRE